MPEIPRREWREDRFGFLRWLPLPRPGWNEWWERIHVDGDVKRRLAAYADFCLRHRRELSGVGLPMHGIVLLHGPPGTGKSSLARGLADLIATGLVRDGVAEQVIFAEVDPHAIPSEMLGESQRNAINLLEKSLPELAEKGYPVIVVIDEVDSLATRRAIAAGGHDPVDVLRATEAILRGVDYLASALPDVLVVATSNFVVAIDEAMLDRVDLTIEIPLPTPELIEAILGDSLAELPSPSVSPGDLSRLAAAMEGMSGRAVRKLVLETLVTRSDGPDKPLTTGDLLAVLDGRRKARP